MLFFKLPFENHICTVIKDAEKECVRFIPFHLGTEIQFRGSIIDISESDFLSESFTNKSISTTIKDLYNESENDYLKTVEHVIHFIKSNNLRKLVYSRRKIQSIVSDSTLDLKQSFLNLCEKYPEAFVYLFNKNNECWIGSFSEVLGKFNKKNGLFETMSLAGTLPLNAHWSDKEIDEQKTVTDYLHNILTKYDIEKTLNRSETKDHKSGNIKHLRTDFSIKIEESKLDHLISELHPTPAVCGIPKDVCIEAIQHFERLPRQLYSGYTKIETETFVYYFVNLRCATIHNDAVIIHVGGGITAQSNPAKEWNETELKSQAIITNLAIS